MGIDIKVYGKIIYPIIHVNQHEKILYVEILFNHIKNDIYVMNIILNQNNKS